MADMLAPDSPDYLSLHTVLERLGLGALHQRFSQEQIDINIVKSLSDTDLNRLGVETIGDRFRLREMVSSASTISPSTRSGSETAPPTMATELGSLFGPTRSRFSSRLNRKATRPRTWTGKFVCLSDKNKNNTPTSAERMELQKSGLGCKKIQFNSTDDEEKVYKVLCSEFPLLKNCGGIEVLHCGSNCRMLQVIDGKWDAQTLKTLVGNQANIYIRPIQTSILVQTQSMEGKSQIQEVCKTCKKQIYVIDMRKHIEECQTILVSASHETETLEMETSIEANDLLDSNIGNVQVSVYESSENVLVNSQPQSVHLYEVANAIQLSVNMGDINVQEQTEIASGVQQQLVDGGIDVQEQLVSDYINQEQSVTGVAVADVKELSPAVDEIIEQTVQFCKLNHIENPVEILNLVQKEMVTGRNLDVKDEAELLTGLTNFILVDRDDCLKSAMDEIRSLVDLRMCLEVQFYGESAVDLGGPRKEFFTIVLQKIQEEYFDQVKEWSGEYEVIGKIMALSILQNGKLPRILSAELITEVFHSDTPRAFIKDLRRGLDALGLFQLASRLPAFVHLFTPQTVTLTFRMLSSLLKPNFSPQGSNRRLVENSVYRDFNNYLREASAGRRQGVHLSSVLRFVTGADEEPALGFTIQPSLHFVTSLSFLPSANTCTNRLNLTIPTDDLQLPSSKDLFKMFDYAFVNSYFGYE